MMLASDREKELCIYLVLVMASVMYLAKLGPSTMYYNNYLTT